MDYTFNIALRGGLLKWITEKFNFTMWTLTIL